MLLALTRFAEFLWATFLVLAPMLLLGLFLAGLIHVLISRRVILQWLSGDSVKAVCTSAAIGVPLPLCSCSVVPVVAEMRNKGASGSSCMSFLITAPETGVDSILVTHGFFGAAAAVVRPLVSFLTGVVVGMLSIGLAGNRDEREGPHCHHCQHGDEEDQNHGHLPLRIGGDGCYVSPSQFAKMFADSLRKIWRRGSLSPANPGSGQSAAKSDGALTSRGPERAATDEDAENEPPSLGKVIRHIFRYGFVEVADEILFALVVGVLLGGVLYLALPDDLLSSQYARWISYPVMVIVGIPLYICASGSTPIAAALVAKGLSPGAALIFLMTGPATNSGTIAIIFSRFGSRFASTYVIGVTAVTFISGIAVDVILLALGLSLPVNLSASESPAILAIESAAAFALLGLMAWRFQRGALRSGLRDLMSNLSPKAWQSRRA